MREKQRETERERQTDRQSGKKAKVRKRGNELHPSPEPPQKCIKIKKLI